MLLDAYVRMGDPRAVQIMAAMSGVAVEVSAEEMEEAAQQEDKELLDTEVDEDGLKAVTSAAEAKRIGTVLFCQKRYERAIKAYRKALGLVGEEDEPASGGKRQAASLHGCIAMCEMEQHNWR